MENENTVECTALSTSVIVREHEKIGANLIEKTKALLASDPEIKSYLVNTEYEDVEELTLKHGKDTVRIRYVRGKY